MAASVHSDDVRDPVRLRISDTNDRRSLQYAACHNCKSVAVHDVFVFACIRRGPGSCVSHRSGYRQDRRGDFWRQRAVGGHEDQRDLRDDHQFARWIQVREGAAWTRLQGHVQQRGFRTPDSFGHLPGSGGNPHAECATRSRPGHPDGGGRGFGFDCQSGHDRHGRR
jgi:hypothetical protein